MKWIPITQETPTEGQRILVCHKGGTMLCTKYSSKHLASWLAWMPLPEPYNPNVERKCSNCKFLTYRFNKVWCDIKCDNPHNQACDKYQADTPQTEQTERSE